MTIDDVYTAQFGGSLPAYRRSVSSGKFWADEYVSEKRYLDNSRNVAYVLYKRPVQLDTLHVVQYLHHAGISVEPQACIERNHPPWVASLPTIHDLTNQQVYVGLDACITFYERLSGIPDLLQKSRRFKERNPEYRIHSS
jgi:hypothetical protein